MNKIIGVCTKITVIYFISIYIRITFFTAADILDLTTEYTVEEDIKETSSQAIDAIQKVLSNK